MTAGIAGLLSAFPADKRPTAGDVVGSSVHIDTPFGMTIALAAVWCGAGLRLIGPSKPTWEADTNALQELELTGPEQDNPSLLFLSPEHHAVLLAAVQMSLERSPFASIITRNKINDMFAGYVGRSGLIEHLAAGTRTAFGGLAGSKLRALVVVGREWHNGSTDSSNYRDHRHTFASSAICPALQDDSIQLLRWSSTRLAPLRFAVARRT